MHTGRSRVRHADDDLPDTPHINLAAVLSGTKQQLWRPIPPSDDTVGVLAFLTSCVLLDSNYARVECTREAEVGDFEVAVGGDEEVVGF